MQELDDTGLGLESTKVRLVDYDPRWPKFYEREAERVRQAVGHFILGIEHIGSTAIPNLRAKPILDIMVGVPSLETAPTCIEPLETIGYQYCPQAGVPNDFVFGKETRRTHLLHVVAFGGENWLRNLRFRDTLRSDPALAAQYVVLKDRLSLLYSEQRAAYTQAKAGFIMQIASP